jgi:2'-5' RNA ligase
MVVGRLFLGVDPPDEIRLAFAALLTEALDGRPLPGRPVAPPNWHITLRFLGQTDETRYERVLGTLSESELGAPFTVRFSGLGAFPRPSRATVLWLGIDEGAGPLTVLADLCEEAARSAGFAAEERPFHPHLTLSRIRPHQDVSATIARVPEFGRTMQVDRITVFRSHLGRGGAQYERLEELPL